MVRFSTCVVFSMRSAAALSALATAICVARARSVAATRTSRRVSSSSSSARMRCVGVEQFVAHRQRRHHGEARIADLAELAAQLSDPRFQALGELQQPHLLAFLAGHAVLPAVDGDVDVAHAVSPASASSTARMVPIAASSLFGDLAIGALQPARLHQRAVEFVGEPRAIGAERLDPARQFVLVAVGVAPPLDRAFQRIERRHQPPRRGVDVGGDRLGGAGPVGGTIAHERQRAPSIGRPRQQNPRFGKRLGGEIYVASEASATPPRSYAPLSNFSHCKRVSLPWTPGIEVLSSPSVSVPQGTMSLQFAGGRIVIKHLISGGFSS